jgi:hypothetical protein
MTDIKRTVVSLLVALTLSNSVRAASVTELKVMSFNIWS